MLIRTALGAVIAASLVSHAQALTATQAVIKACDYVIPTPNIGFLDARKFIPVRQPKLSGNQYKLRGTLEGEPGTCYVDARYKLQKFVYDKPLLAEINFKALNRRYAFQEKCYDAIDSLSHTTGKYKMRGVPKLVSTMYIWPGTVMGEPFKCQGTLTQMGAAFVQPGAAARINRRVNASLPAITDRGELLFRHLAIDINGTVVPCPADIVSPARRCSTSPRSSNLIKLLLADSRRWKQTQPWNNGAGRFTLTGQESYGVMVLDNPGFRLFVFTDATPR